MIGTKKYIDQIIVTLRDIKNNSLIPVYINVFDNSLSMKWLQALNHLVGNSYHLEKNYCFLGFANSDRNGEYILDKINQSIQAINDADIGYKIQDFFSVDNTITEEPVIDYRGVQRKSRNIVKEKFNNLHRYFEDLQGQSGKISRYYNLAPPLARWHIRQLNLLCHEFESWALSYRKQIEAPEWQRPSQLMCWLNAPRFVLTEEDYELFGVDTINRPTGGVFVGVNKSVGKHHWEVFTDEGQDSVITDLVTSALISQTEAAGDFDIEWAQDPSPYDWQVRRLDEFRAWLRKNGLDPDDKSLTIGHPQVAQVDLLRSFGTEDFREIWKILDSHLDVYSIETSDAHARYSYHWSDHDYIQRQVDILEKGR